MPATGTMTADQFLALPASHASERWALVDGELVVDEPLLPHQVTSLEIAHALLSWARAAAGRGLVSLPIDVFVDDQNVYAPDVVWYAEGHDPGGHPYSVPDLAIEVRSPSTWRYDIGAKKAGYERAGLPELWLVDDIARTVLVFRRSAPEVPTFDVALELDAEATLGSPLMPGFALPVAELFGD